MVLQVGFPSVLKKSGLIKVLKTIVLYNELSTASEKGAKMAFLTI